MRVNVRAAAVLALPLYLSGCYLFSGLCNYEIRSVWADGTVTEGIMEVGRGTVHVGASRGSDNHRSLDWFITSTPLEGHITAVRLVESTRPTETLVDLPSNRPAAPGIIGGFLQQAEGELSPALGGIFEIVRTNRALLEVTTDLADRPQVIIPLTVTQGNDWSRPHCS